MRDFPKISEMEGESEIGECGDCVTRDLTLTMTSAFKNRASFNIRKFSSDRKICVCIYGIGSVLSPGETISNKWDSFNIQVRRLGLVIDKL